MRGLRRKCSPVGDGAGSAIVWAHVRRKFYELADTSPVATEVLRRVALLYAIEDEVRGLSAEQRRAVRHDRRGNLLNDHIAGKHGSHLVLHLQSFMGKPGVACSENSIWSELNANLVVERSCHVDVRHHAKTLIGQSIPRFRNSFVDIPVDDFREII